MVTVKDLAKMEDLLLKGNAACAGCPIGVALRTTLKALGKKTIMFVPACCTSVVQGIGPGAAISVPLFNTAFETAASVASGAAAAAEILGKDVTILAWAGDGGTYDIGLQAISGAAERGDNVLYICYNNQMYSNTGIQRSGATPLGAWTTTTWTGKTEHMKDMGMILIAHRVPYVAATSVGYPDDIYEKVKKAKEKKGFRYIDILAPCPPGWRFPSDMTIRLGKLAIETGFWLLYEYEDGELRFNGYTKLVAEGKREFKPVEEFLRLQDRFRHLFEPKRRDDILEEIQRWIKERFEWYLSLAKI